MKNLPKRGEAATEVSANATPLGSGDGLYGDSDADENLWLEDIYGAEPLAWVRERNARTEKALNAGAAGAEFARLEADILEVLDSKDRIPSVVKRHSYYYNFWLDDSHPRGLWRRTSWESYQKDEPEWETVLDIDALGAEEGTQWVWHAPVFLRPPAGEPYRRCLIALSPDGGDAHTFREFDVVEKRFIPVEDGGFVTPVAKAFASWQDPDTLILSTDFGPGSQTSSSYPRTARILHRGSELKDAEPYFEVAVDHVMGRVIHDSTPGFERDIAIDVIDFFSQQVFLRRNGTWLPLDVPVDVHPEIHQQWLLLRPQSDTLVHGVPLRSGSLHAIVLEEFLAGSSNFIAVFTPDDHSALQAWSWTRNYLLLELLQDVSSKILVADPEAGFSSLELDVCPPLHSASISAVDADNEGECPEGNVGDDYWLTITGFLTPTTLIRGKLSKLNPPENTSGHKAAQQEEPTSEAQVVKNAPSFFDESRFTVSQHFAVSRDGTRVPYFQISPAAAQLDGQNPVCLYGYGGFEVSCTPGYSGIRGRGWLERGGTFVVANIRGGGEYGPAWHTAALKEKRHRAYEDFAAIAEDLIRRKVTCREKLACHGGSNGGLLVGNMLTSFPELFGAISCGVPLLDMRRYTKLNAGHSWIAEYGDPELVEEWEYIKTFSPYHLLKAETDYPATFIWTATSDDRVGPVQARKMAARMERLGIEPLWYYESLEGGHSGAADNKQAARLQAAPLEFMWRALHGENL